MPLRYFRAKPAKSQGLRVDRTGGKFGAGVIRRASLITAGEALGHGDWIDGYMVESVTEAVNQSKKGAKVRFTHPSLSGDGLGRFMGRAFDAETVGDQAVADIHFAKAAHETPDGDLASYVMSLAEEDPEAFAISIAFARDTDAEEEFAADNSGKDGFTSPDNRNAKNLPHVRLSELMAADFVDSPAANPGGLFHRGHKVAQEADKFCAFALGLSDEKPSESFFSADADRVAAFAQRFLSNRGLILMSKEQETPPVVDPVVVTVEQFNELSAQLAEATAKIAELSAKPDENTPDPAEVERARCRELYAIASKCGLDKSDELADKWIADGFSAVEAKASLADRLIAENGMSKDAGQQENDPHAAFRAEFREQSAELAKYGVTDEDAYVRSRCRDEGLPVPAIKKAG